MEPISHKETIHKDGTVCCFWHYKEMRHLMLKK